MMCECSKSDENQQQESERSNLHVTKPPGTSIEQERIHTFLGSLCQGSRVVQSSDSRRFIEHMNGKTWEAYAVRYAHHIRSARENFIAGDPHDDSPMPLDYYVWVLRSA